MSAASARNVKSGNSGSEDPLLKSLSSQYLEGITISDGHDNLGRDLLEKTTLDEARKQWQYDNKIDHKSMLLHPTTSAVDSRLQKAQKVKQRLALKRKPRPLSAKEKRKLALNKLPAEAQSYDMYKPLHDLWAGYIRETTQTGGYEAKLLKADYHGAQVKVTKCTSPSMLFLQGIVIKETRNTFVICTAESTIKTIPKRCTVFEFEVNLISANADATSLLKWEIHGEHFGFRAADRVGKKFKGKHTVDI